jgi:hypothetical protein
MDVHLDGHHWWIVVALHCRSVRFGGLQPALAALPEKPRTPMIPTQPHAVILG